MYIDISDIDDIDVYILPPKFKKLSLFFLAQKREPRRKMQDII